MILVIICGHISSLLFSSQVYQPTRSFLFLIPACFFFAILSFIVSFLLSFLSSMVAVKMDEDPSAFVTSSPCFPIKNNRRAFFLTVAREIISSRSFLSKHFCRQPISTEKEKKRRLREAMFLYFFLSELIHLLSIISRCSVLLKSKNGNLLHCVLSHRRNNV